MTYHLFFVPGTRILSEPHSSLSSSSFSSSSSSTLSQYNAEKYRESIATRPRGYRRIEEDERDYQGEKYIGFNGDEQYNSNRRSQIGYKPRERQEYKPRIQQGRLRSVVSLTQ